MYHRATRKGTYCLIGLTGQSGSGKTMSAILMARGLVGPNGKIALLDTENGRGSVFEGLTPYDVDELWPPFTPKRYTDKAKDAEKAGYDVLIIDSGSHEWEGEGGVLEMAEATGKQGLQKWLKPKTEHKKLINAILQSRMHVILCLRGKEKLMQVKNHRTGKDEIVNAGIVPIQEGRVLYEMTVSLIMSEENQRPTIRKCPYDLRAAFPEGQLITEKTGEAIAEWIGGMPPVDQEAEALKIEAREAVKGGSEKMRGYWTGLTKEQRSTLQPILSDLQSAARAADETAQSPEPEESSDDPLDDPFTPATESGPNDTGALKGVEPDEEDADRGSAPCQPEASPDPFADGVPLVDETGEVVKTLRKPMPWFGDLQTMMGKAQDPQALIELNQAGALHWCEQDGRSANLWQQCREDAEVRAREPALGV